MALERRDPLPAGRYSIFINQEEMGRWSDWVKAHSATVRVNGTIEKREAVSRSLLFSLTPGLDVIWKTVGASIAFTVSAPTPWVGLGFPDIETRPITEWQKEETELPKDETTGPLEQVRTLVIFGGLVYLAAAWLKRK